MYVDAALDPDERALVEQHIRECESCNQNLQAWVNERNLLQTLVKQVDDVALPDGIPSFKKRMGLRGFLLANLATGGLIWLIQFVWKTLFGELAVELFLTVLSRIPIPVPDGFDVLVEAGLLFIFEGGVNLVNNYLMIVGFIVATLCVWFAFVFWRTRAKLMVLFVAALGTGLLVPAESMAIEVRYEKELITVVEDEVIEDTLVAAGETIVVNGDINGDLLAFSRRVVVNGDVSGNLFTFAESITVRGSVGGMVIGASRSMEVEAAEIGGDLWTATNNVSVGSGTSIRGNILSFAEAVEFSGMTERDLVAFAEHLEVNGIIGEDIEAFSYSLDLLGDARVGGKVRFRGDMENFQQSVDAIIDSGIEFLDMPDEFEHESRFMSDGYYIFQLIRLIAAFLAGLLLFWLLPVARDIDLKGGLDSLKAAGVGLIALISMPIIMLLLAVTLVGLPVAIVGLFLWLCLIYFAKIALAWFLGKVILGSRGGEEKLVLTLLVGLLAVIVAVSLPSIGVVINFLLTITGAGMLVLLLLNRQARGS